MPCSSLLPFCTWAGKYVYDTSNLQLQTMIAGLPTDYIRTHAHKPALSDSYLILNTAVSMLQEHAWDLMHSKMAMPGCSRKKGLPGTSCGIPRDHRTWLGTTALIGPLINLAAQIIPWLSANSSLTGISPWSDRTTFFFWDSKLPFPAEAKCWMHPSFCFSAASAYPTMKITFHGVHKSNR